MSSLERQIDELYGLPLTEFTAARNALAKTLKGDDAARVKRLEKPSVVAWSVNQLYWTERRTFDRLMASGRDLRAAQIAALKGRTADLRTASSAHRATISDAVAAATRIAGVSGVHPATEPLARMLEALSLAHDQPEHPGRFTELIQPAGFEALAGITPVARPAKAPPHKAVPAAAPEPLVPHPKGDERRRAQAEAAARKAAEGALAAARNHLDKAQAARTVAQAHVDAVRQQLARAEAALDGASKAADAAEQDVARTEAALKALSRDHSQRDA